MVDWVWIPISAVAGILFGIFVIALFSANE